MRPIARYGFIGNVRKLLSQAAFFIDAKESGMGQTATNLGTAGSVLDAQYGSTTGADTNDPLLLEHDGTNYLYLPGVAGNYASTPDSAALDITGDIDIRVRVALDDWTPAANQNLMSKWQISGQRSWQLLVQTSGTLRLLVSGDGTAPTASAVSTVATGLADGSANWVRATYATATGNTDFYLSDDGVTWSALGTTVSATATAIHSGTSILEIGSVAGGTAFYMAGRMFRAIVRDGIGGTVVFDADFTTGITSGAQTTFTESSSNAATVTINRSTSGRKSVAVVRPVWLFGTDDYLEVADNALLDFEASDSFTVVAVVRQWATQSSNQTYIDKRSAGNVGYTIVTTATAGRVAFYVLDGTFLPNGNSPDGTLGSIRVVAGVRNVTTDSLTAYNNGIAGTSATDTTTATLANASPFRIGSYAPSAANFADMELLAVAIFRRALSADEIASIANYYGAS